MKTFFYYYILLCITVIITAGIFYFYETQIDGIFINKPITFYTNMQHIPTDKSVYHVGDDIYLKISFCRNRDFTVSAQWSIVNETVVFFPEFTAILKPECVNKLFHVGIVPFSSFLGKHHLEGRTDVLLNPFHTIHFTYRSEDFDVIK